jgi:hypothetical protein
MKGKIVLIGTDSGFVGIRTEQGDYSVLELLGGYDVELGDEVTSNFYNCSSAAVKNLTQSETMDVSIEAAGLTREQARALLRSFSS